MVLAIGTWDNAWGHTYVARGFGKIYALRSLAGGSSLCVFDEDGNPLGEYSTPGAHSCHITLLEKQAVVADYTSGTLSLFPLGTDGLPSGAPEVLHFEGSGPNLARQQGPHIHSSWLSPDGASLVLVDLGADRLYRFPVEDEELSREGIEMFPMPPGCGPRHCAFGKDKLYVATELSDEVLVLDWPSMELLQKCVVNPAQPGGGGHIVISPDGKFLYVSSRLKNDGIGIFCIGEDGLLEAAGYCNTGRHPRHFCLTPSGDALVVACRDDDVIEFYNRSSKDGSLSPAGIEVSIERPVFVDAFARDQGL